MVGATPCINNEQPAYEFNIYINTSNWKNHTIIIPIPIHHQNNQVITEVIEGIEITSGNAEYQLEYTTYGVGLNISGKGNVTIHSSGIRDSYSIDTLLSLMANPNPDSGEYWVYTEYNGSTFDLELMYEFKQILSPGHQWQGSVLSIENKEEVPQEITLAEGWNKIYIDTIAIVT